MCVHFNKKKTHHTQTVLCVSSVLSLCLQDSVVSKYRPLDELKRDMAQLEVLVETDAQVHQSVFEIKVFTVSQSSLTHTKGIKHKLVSYSSIGTN